MTIRILIVYDTNSGNTYQMARRISRGVNSAENAEAIIRAVPKVSSGISGDLQAAVPDAGAPYAQQDDLHKLDGLIIGSPTHFGNMSASLKYFLDQTTPAWFGGTLAGKPGAAFTSTGSMHGGQEATLLSMMLPLLHHGMVLCGLPYQHPELMQTVRAAHHMVPAMCRAKMLTRKWTT